jgi:hypothetical protein
LELHCEVQYAKFVKSRGLPKILQGKIRADLVIAVKPSGPPQIRCPNSSSRSNARQLPKA